MGSEGDFSCHRFEISSVLLRGQMADRKAGISLAKNLPQLSQKALF